MIHAQRRFGRHHGTARPLSRRSAGWVRAAALAAVAAAAAGPFSGPGPRAAFGNSELDVVTNGSADLTAAGTRTAGFAIAAVIARPIGGIVSDKIGPRTVMIVSLAGEPNMRAWRIADGRVEEEPVTVV